MRRMFRPALLAAGVAAVALASGASAATGPSTFSFSDDKGDAIPTDAYDITSAKLTTTGVTTTKTVKRKKTTTYTPKALVVSMTLAAPPSTVPGTLYELDAETSTCGSLLLYFTPGADGSGALVGCGSEPDPATGSEATTLAVEPTVAGNTITWTLPLASLPPQVKVGTTISEFAGYSAQVDPATGVVGPYLLTSALNYDNAASDGVYKLG
jgi:hypothetical protein